MGNGLRGISGGCRLGKMWFNVENGRGTMWDKAMIPQQRQRAILEAVARQGAARTQDLAERFQVTVETIRRDLETLHQEGLLVRTHGGAIAGDHPTLEQNTRERQVIRLAEKRALASRAVTHIQPRDIVFLDASSTALQIALQLPDLELTVVTHSLDVLESLEDRRGVKLIGTGGHYARLSRSFVGKVALETARRYHIRKFFFSGNGIDLERGLSESNEEQAELKSELIALAERCYFLSDSSKTGHRAAYFFAPPEAIDVWITSEPEPPASLEPFVRRIGTVETVDSRGAASLAGG